MLQKTGKWNAMHVRIAWEIYHHQQKQATEAKVVGGSVGPPKADLLRPPTHLFPPRPHDMSHFTAPHRAPHPFDASPHPASGPFQTLGKLLDSTIILIYVFMENSTCVNTNQLNTCKTRIACLFLDRYVH